MVRLLAPYFYMKAKSPLAFVARLKLISSVLEKQSPKVISIDVGWIKRSGSTIVMKPGGTALLVPPYKIFWDL